MKIAAQLFTVRDYTQTPEDFAETLKRVKQIGYDSVQLSAIGPLEAEFIKKCIDETKLDVCATHTNPDRIINDTDSVIAEHKLWNCKCIGIGGYGALWAENGLSLKEKADDFINKFTPIIKKINDAGLTFLYHNHALEFQHVEKGKTLIEYLDEKMPSDGFGILADFYWTQVGGANALEFISKYAKRLKVVHFKDLLPKDNAPAMAPVGEGNMNYKAIYDALTEIGTEALAVEQDDCNGEDPFDCLTRSYNNIKKFL